MKQCYKCKQFKLFSDFTKCKTRKDGHDVYCKSCNKSYREANKEKLKLNKLEYYARPEVIERAKEYKKKYWAEKRDELLPKMREHYNTPETRAKKLWFSIRERCKNKSIPFNLEPEDIVIPEYCPLLEIKLTHELGKGMVDTNSSVDRLIPELGYVKGNIQVISLLANQMKNSATPDQLITFSKNILKQYGMQGTTVKKYADAILKEKGLL